ncbi:hypothetical protein EGW08_000082, partial [Elysia chlorotica]
MYRDLVLGVLITLQVTQVTSQCYFSIDTSGLYNLTVSTKPWWLSSGPFAFSSGGQWLSTEDGTLAVSNISTLTAGDDVLGNYTETTWRIFHPSSDATMEAAIRSYDTNDSFVMFVQRFPNGLQKSATHPNKTISAFPSFRLDNQSEKGPGKLGYLSWGSYMLGDMDKKAGVLGPNATFNDGLDGSGPLVIFDQKGHALVLSPFNNFMAASVWQDDHAPLLDWGIMGGVDSLPPGFEHKTLAFCSNDGIGH